MRTIMRSENGRVWTAQPAAVIATQLERLAVVNACTAWACQEQHTSSASDLR